MTEESIDNIHPSAHKLVSTIRYERTAGNYDTYDIVLETMQMLRKIVCEDGWNTAKELIESMKLNGKYVINAIPVEASIGNMVRRVLQIIREEYISELKNKPDDVNTQESLHKIITSENDENIDFNIPVTSLREAIFDHIEELQIELEACFENITKQASEHIHSNEIIMTLGRSKMVEKFLKKAAKTRTFEVIVAEGGPLLQGHQMAANLAKHKIKTTLISDVAIFAMMSRVNKVIISTHTVMANGGLRALTGSRTVAQAAKHFSVPVMVLLPPYKLSPLYLCSYEQNAFNKHVAPIQGVIDGANAALLERIQAYNPVFDYVPPELVDLFITNTGGNSPSYVYRLVTEIYHPDDYEL